MIVYRFCGWVFERIYVEFLKVYFVEINVV